MDLDDVESLLQRVASKHAKRKDITLYHRLVRENNILCTIAWPPYVSAAEKAVRHNNIYMFGTD